MGREPSHKDQRGPPNNPRTKIAAPTVDDQVAVPGPGTRNRSGRTRRRSELRVLEDAGHMVIIEKPDTIAELVASRISRLT